MFLKILTLRNFFEKILTLGKEGPVVSLKKFSREFSDFKNVLENNLGFLINLDSKFF